MEFPDPKKLENWVSYASKHRYRAVAAVVIFARFPFLIYLSGKSWIGRG